MSDTSRPGRRGKIYMHRFILSPADGIDIDHIDHNGLNNSRANLREATSAENSRNTKKRASKTSSAFKGVSWDSLACRWKAQISCNRRHKHIGLFTSERDAAAAYDAHAAALFGKFAHLNFEALNGNE